MALKAHLDTGSLTHQSTDERSSERRSLLLEASGVLPGGVEANVIIHNISAAGLLLETDLPLREGEALLLDLPEVGAVPAIIVWQSGNLYGCAFEQALAPATLAAVQLRSDAPETTREAPLHSTAEPLGVRLNKLRRERGLTLAQVASALGVSKPTVWAWEKGKARPVPERLGPIAEALGVQKEDLVDRLADEHHSALVQDCRLRIATAFGTQPSKVRIMIEV